MPRIFASLSVFAIALLVGNLMFGLIGGDYNGLSARLRAAQDRIGQADAGTRTEASPEAARDAVLAELVPVQQHVRIHMLIGILAALVTVMVQSIGVTYFIGTGRWVKEVCESYPLPEEYTVRGTQLKRRAFPWAMLGMAVVLLIACFGAAADPGTLRETTAAWVQPHLWSAVIGTALIAAALHLQWRYIGDQQSLIEEIVVAVHDIRVERGLPVESS